MLVERPGRKPLRVVWELLPGQLYIGGTLKKMEERELGRVIGFRAGGAGINVILNVGQHDARLTEMLQRWAVPSLAQIGEITQTRYLLYQHYRVPDSATRVPVELMQPVVDRAVAEISAGHRVLSMCYGGRNRSGLLAALTIMRVRGCSGQEAYDLIRATKPNTFYNELYGDYVKSLPALGAAA